MLRMADEVQRVDEHLIDEGHDIWVANERLRTLRSSTSVSMQLYVHRLLTSRDSGTE